MNKDTRIKKITEIIEGKEEPLGRIEIPWKDALVAMNYYKIPLEYLIYNKFNGRILSRTKSLESHDHEINAEMKEGEAIIDKLLWESKEDRNKQTLESIKSHGQEKVGIITRDGIIIDGNRRAMLLKRSGDYDYFKAVVLPVTLENDPLEIEKLETIYQMGEDEKLGYNPIEKYLKARGLKQKGVAEDKIASWMGEDVSAIKSWLSIMDTMDDYLEYLKYNKIYTQLDGREDQFINLNKWLSNFYGENSAKGFDGYKDSDVDDLKTISYDYIRIKFEGKRFRKIADGLKGKHIFGDKAIWVDFREKHIKNVDPIKDSEDQIDYNSENLKRHLDDRDEKFSGQAEPLLNENLELHCEQLGNKEAAGKPINLISKAISAIDAIDQRHKAFAAPEVLEKIEDLNKITASMLKEKSPKRIFSSVIKLLESVEFKNAIDEKSDLLSGIKDVQRIAYQVEKDIKDL
ncbi:MAG: hypothetical protein WA103_01395 [Minisyncoccales bacterium]